MISSTNQVAYLSKKVNDFHMEFRDFELHVRNFYDFYDDIDLDSLRQMLSFLHGQLNHLFKYMNQRIGSGHYTASESRLLLHVMNELRTIQSNVRGSQYEFQENDQYKTIMEECLEFLQESGGSPIPVSMKRIEVIETQPVFRLQSSIAVDRGNQKSIFAIKPIGHGSYATVYKYNDEFYDRVFAIKRANKNLTSDEYQRFKTEFEIIKSLNSPYVVEVYRFDENRREYYMEYVDTTLHDYILRNNNSIDTNERIGFIRQALRAFHHIHQKDVLHRDISTKNVLIKIYDEIKVIKISDFGLVKIPRSELTKSGTEVKGYLNDPKLSISGFKYYEMRHETYALVRLIYFIMTGRLQMGRFINNEFKLFIEKGMADDLDERYQDVKELQAAFDSIVGGL